MENDRSYIISISYGKGCYRHIKIDVDSSLYDLHEAILTAFDFIDDHAHAFFMNNLIWDEDDSYYSEHIEDEEQYTCDYKLSELDLEPGDVFKYVFDFGDEWVFQCKVLNIIDERTDIPEVIREKGEPPMQYESAAYEYNDDDEDEDDFDG